MIPAGRRSAISTTDIEEWKPNHFYNEGEEVIINGLIYSSQEDHLSSNSFEDDLNDGKWEEISPDKHYRHVQGSPATTWSVTHNLNKFPSITVVDSAGTEVIGDYKYVDKNNVTLNFSSPFSGEAYFN